MEQIILIACSIVAGALGALLGLGGGLIVVPVLTLGFNVDIRYAITASLISVIATSSGAAASFLKQGFTNLRLAVFLESATVSGALVGYFLAGKVPNSGLFILFGGILLFSALMMLRRRDEVRASVDHPWSKRLGFAGSYPGHSGKAISYGVENVPMGYFWMFFAGILSALLGIGSGVLKVLAMDSAMRLPLKVSSATSNLMIGVTAAGSAGAYFLSGDIRPEIAAPVALGILIGSWFGARAMTVIPLRPMRLLFVGVLLVVSAQMIYRGLR